ncbi:putative ribonuclease H-like domain-containing protein, partial [Tanacetum coccineum]
MHLNEREDEKRRGLDHLQQGLSYVMVIKSFVDGQRRKALDERKRILKNFTAKRNKFSDCGIEGSQVNKFKKKAGRKIEFDKKEAARFNKKAVRCYKCLQKGHFARECRAKRGNEKRYSSFKIQELGKKEGFAPKEYGMVAGCGAACEEGAAEVYSLITGNGTDVAAGEFALMGMTSE